MADSQHNAIANADLHEPSGTDTAEAGQVYVFRTSSIAEWQDVHYSSMKPEGLVAPAHKTLTTPTSYTALGMVGFEENEQSGSLVGGQGPSITWDDSFPIIAQVSWNVCLQHTDAGAQSVFATLMKNGVALTNYELEENQGSNLHLQLADTVMLRLVFGDVLTIAVKAAAGNLTIHNAYISAWGVKE